MKYTGITGIVLSVTLAGGVLAHSGATGVVKERMDGMMAMSKAIKAVTPVMRGKVDYDAARVRDFAATIKEHSGETMTKLFPEGSEEAPSVAKPRIWEDWSEFEALAVRLGTLAEGLDRAADNGLKAAGGASASMMGGDTMMGGQSMMGGDDMMGGGGMMGGSGPMTAELDPAQLAEMPADAVFRMVSQTCAACHTKFRAEK